MLRRVAVFAAPFGLAAATAVAGYDPVEPARVADALGRLAEHSLLVSVASAGGTRYHALEPVRQFAAARLDAEGDGDGDAYRRHLGWCLTEAAGLDRADPAEPEWQAAFDAAADEFRAALARSAALPAQQADAGRLAATLSGLLFTRGRLREAQQRYEQAAALAGDAAAGGLGAGVRGRDRQDPDRGRARRCGWTGRPPPRTCEPVIRRPPRSPSPAVPSTSTGSPACTPACPPRAPRAGCWPTRGPHATPASDPRAAAAIGSAGAQDPGLTGAQAAELAGLALRLARQAGDPLLISAAYDAVTAGLMTEGDIPRRRRHRRRARQPAARRWGGTRGWPSS